MVSKKFSTKWAITEGLRLADSLLGDLPPRVSTETFLEITLTFATEF